MISSTALDLPHHREGVIDACLRMGIRPLAMEHLGTDGLQDPAQASLEMVDQADFYIAIIGWRYGYVPVGSTLSITEMEYRRAIERRESGQPLDILVFLMHSEHPVMVDEVDEDRYRIREFRARLESAHTRAEFRSIEELRTLIMQALWKSLAKKERAAAIPSGSSEASRILPTKPQPYTAHPYSLLQTSRVIGRSTEREVIEHWAEVDRLGDGLLFVVAMGGMGKSALTWRWYSQLIAAERPTYDGAMWWSFYENGAGYEEFVTHCCAYVSDTPEAQLRTVDFSDREDLLLSCLESQRILIVLDGAERLLRAYSTLDATYIHDDSLDEQTAHAIATRSSIREEKVTDFKQRRRLREFTDHRAARLFTRMLHLRRSRVLVSSRLFPSNLENDWAQPLPGCRAMFLRGMSSRDAIELWREFGVSGATADLVQVFDKLENYPLAIRALAGTVARFRPAPGDFNRWRQANPDFLRSDDSINRSTRHVLRYALADLSESELQVLRILAAFRMPVDWAVVVDVVKRIQQLGYRFERYPYIIDEVVLNDVLTALEDRGLVGWDRTSNRYDLHPVVRLHTWNSTSGESREQIMQAVFEHFSARLADVQSLRGTEGLNTQIEVFHALCALGRHDEAYNLFRRELHEVTLYTESLLRLHIELLEQLFTNGPQKVPAVSGPKRRRLHSWLTYANLLAGEPSAAIDLTVGALRPHWIMQTEPNWRQLYFAFAECGRLREAEAALALVLLQSTYGRDYAVSELSILPWLTKQLDVRGLDALADECSERLKVLNDNRLASLSPISDLAGARRRFRDQLLSADRLLDHGQVDEAVDLLNRASATVDGLHRRREMMRFLCILGRARRLAGNLDDAGRHLEQALLLSRSHGVPAIEVLCLIELARVARDSGHALDALTYLRDVYEPAARGPYPIEEANARILTALLARESGDFDMAVREATAAYTKAWCDGPPFSYAAGLREARSVLTHCGADVPSLPSYDDQRFLVLPQLSVVSAETLQIEIFTADSVVSEMRGFPVDHSRFLAAFVAVASTARSHTPSSVARGPE